jgi:hypothetical protein
MAVVRCLVHRRMRVVGLLLGTLLTAGCGPRELPIPPDPYRSTRELTPDDVNVLRALIQQSKARRVLPISVADRTMRICDPTDVDGLCATPFEVGLLRGTSFERIARGMYVRNRLSMAIPNRLGADVQIVPMTAEIRGLERAVNGWRSSVFLTTPVYLPNGQAIVFTKQMASYAGWVVLEHHGSSWTITSSTNIPQY